MKKWLLGMIFLLFCPLSVSAQTWSVSSEGEMSLTEALAQCADGDVIEVADGIYNEEKETFPLTVTKSVTVQAAQNAAPVIDAPAFQSAFRVEAANVTLRGLDIRMRRTGIYAIGDDMTVEDCRISLAEEAWRTSSCGMWCGGIYRMTVRGCSFTGCGISLAGPPLSESSTGKPVLTGLFEVGEDIEYFTSHTIENCTVNGKQLFYAVSQEEVTVPEDAGEVICCGCGKVTVCGVDVSDGSMGMVLTYNEQVTIEDSRADRCGVFGMYIAKCSGGILRGCVSEETNHGLDLRACRNFVLEDCQALNCDQGLFFSCMEDSIMTDCTVTGTGQGYFMAAGSGNMIYNCTAEACENGFNLQKEGNVLMTDCTVRDCTVCGVRLDGTPTVFSGNVMEGNWVAVMAYGAVSFDVSDNVFRDSISCALYLRDIAYSRFCGNTFEKNAGESVCAEGTVSGSLWNRNILDKAINSEGETDFNIIL